MRMSRNTFIHVSKLLTGGVHSGSIRFQLILVYFYATFTPVLLSNDCKHDFLFEINYVSISLCRFWLQRGSRLFISGSREEKESVWKVCDWLTTPWLAALLSSSIVRLWAHWQHCHTFPITASQSQLRRARAPTCCCWWQFSLQAKPDCLSVCTQRILHTLTEKARYRGKLENDRGISLSRTWGLSQEWQKCREWRFIFFFGRGVAF